MLIKIISPILMLTGFISVAGCAEIQLRPASVTAHALDQNGTTVKALQVYAFCPFNDNEDSKSIETGTASLTVPIMAPFVLIGIGEKSTSPHQGYYPDRRVLYIFSDKTRPLVHWSPWNPDVYLTYKQIKNPGPMYIPSKGDSLYSGPRGLNLHWPAPIGEEIGFDFIAGDWVAPSGKGTVTDIFVKVEEEDTSRSKPTTYREAMAHPFLKTTFRFPGQDDGLVPFRSLFRLGEGDYPIGSELWHDYEAPKSGYISKFVSDPEAEEAVQRIERPKDAGPDWVASPRSFGKLILRRGTTKEYQFTAYGTGPEAEAAFRRLLETGWGFVRPAAYFRIHSKRLESGEITGMHGVMDTDAIATWHISAESKRYVRVRLRYKLNPDIGSRSLEWNGINLSKPYNRDRNAPLDYMIGISPSDKARVEELKSNPSANVCP